MEPKKFAAMSLDEILVFDDPPTSQAQPSTSQAQPSTSQAQPTTSQAGTTRGLTKMDLENDTGILEFMSAERATELYKKIAAEGVPKLDWKFYGRRKPGEKSAEEAKKEEEEKKSKVPETSMPVEEMNLGFDFDEDFGDPQIDLQLKKRPELKTDRTNLSDIMSDLLKETTPSTSTTSKLEVQMPSELMEVEPEKVDEKQSTESSQPTKPREK